MYNDRQNFSFIIKDENDDLTELKYLFKKIWPKIHE